MKALTVRQPWAWAIIHGGKDVENRTQAWSYRGPLAIHAGQRFDDAGLEHPALLSALPRVGQSAQAAFFARHVTGAIIGVVDLVDVHTCSPGCCSSSWADRDLVVVTSRGPLGQTRSRFRVHLVLANPRPLAHPIPVKGRLGLWTPPADVLEQLREAL